MHNNTAQTEENRIYNTQWSTAGHHGSRRPLSTPQPILLIGAGLTTMKVVGYMCKVNLRHFEA